MSGNKGTVDRFQRLWFDADLQSEVRWLGRKVVKTPTDLWATQEIIHETRPEIIVETGTFHGGSALYYAHLMDALGGPGQVVSVDIAYDPDFDYPNHPRLEFLLGRSSIDPSVVEAVAKRCDGKRTMVILDSDHSCDHVLQELRLYSRFVSVGCYLIVEDTNPLVYKALRVEGPGPQDALKAWQPTNKGFEVDRDRERFLLTLHPGGYLKKIRNQ